MIKSEDVDLITAKFGVQSSGSSAAARRIEAAGLRKQQANDATKVVPMIEPKERSLPQRSRTSAGLRDMLFDVIDEVRLGKISADQAKSISQLTGELLKSVKLEAEVRTKFPSDQDPTNKPLQLGDATAD